MPASPASRRRGMIAEAIKIINSNAPNLNASCIRFEFGIWVIEYCLEFRVSDLGFNNAPRFSA